MNGLSLPVEPDKRHDEKRIYMQSMLMILLCGWLVCPADAAEWSGAGEFGLVIASGNSDTETLNLAFSLERQTEQWRNRLRLTGMRSRDSGQLNAERYTGSYRSGYNFSERSYLFGAIRYDKDEFSSYDYQTTASLGYGRQLIDAEAHQLSFEIGPGLRRAQPSDGSGAETDTIGRLFTDYAWTISEAADLTNTLLVESGSSNTFAENELALKVAINARLALKLAGAVRHNTDVDPGTEKTDTLTTVNLVYNFGSQ